MGKRQKPIPQSLDSETDFRTLNPANSHLRREESEASAVIVSQFREKLDKSISLPGWQDAIPDLLKDLRLPGQRQGIGFIHAILSLPIESKKTLLENLLENKKIGGGRAFAKLVRVWSIKTKPRSSGSHSKHLEKENLRRDFKLRLAKHYHEYKLAQTTLFYGYKGLVEHLANRISYRECHVKDCEQEGFLGLLQAIDRTEPEKNFTGYAAKRAERRMRNFLMKTGFTFSAPINAIEEASRWQGTIDQAKSEKRTTTLAILNLQSRRTEDRVHAKHVDDIPFECIDETSENPFQSALAEDIKTLIEFASKSLTSKQREVLALRFGVFNQEAKDTLQEISKIIGISRQQVSRREERALSALAHMIGHVKEEFA